MLKRSKSRVAESKRGGLVSHLLLKKGDVADGALSVSWVEAAPGSARNVHAHEQEQVYVILRGKAWMRVGDESAEAQEGDLIHAPPDAPHSIANTSDKETLVYLAVATPNAGDEIL